METPIDVFERVEKKYLLDAQQYADLRDAIAHDLQPDQYGDHEIDNIYYDTKDYDLIAHSLESPRYKEKLRLRSYGTAHAEDIVFLELKKKWKGMVYKRRMSLPLAEAERYLSLGIPPTEQGQIFREIDYFVQFYHPMPKLFLAYNRVALFSRSDPLLRITFDHDIRSRTEGLTLSQGGMGTPLLSPETILMEIKTADAMPLWLTHTLSELQIYPTPFSKYGRIFTRDHQEKEPVLCSQACSILPPEASPLETRCSVPSRRLLSGF